MKYGKGKDACSMPVVRMNFEVVSLLGALELLGLIDLAEQRAKVIVSGVIA